MIFENMSMRIVAFVTGGGFLSYMSGYNLNQLFFFMPSLTPERNRELVKHIMDDRND